MPVDDLLRFIGGPLPSSMWWVGIGVLLIVIVIAWCVGIFVWTLAPARLRMVPVIGGLHGRLVRRRFVRSVQHTNELYRSGGLTAAQAGAGVSRVLRSFLFVATGVRRNTCTSATSPKVTWPPPDRCSARSTTSSSVADHAMTWRRWDKPPRS